MAAPRWSSRRDAPINDHYGGIAIYPARVCTITGPLSWGNVGWAGFEPATSASRTGLDPPTRYFAVYSAPAGASSNPSRAAYGGKMAESPGWDADIGRFTTVDQGGTAPLRSPTPATAGSDRRGRHAGVDVGGRIANVSVALTRLPSAVS